MSPKELRPERNETDESLASERAKTDHALREKRAAIEQKADVVLERAREAADDVLTTARAKADETLEQATSPDEMQDELQDAVAQERVLEDEVLRIERARADEVVRRERAASLARLFPFERDKTDLLLLTERARSDDALANRDDFLGMVSHDLRDLLNTIVMSAAALAEDAASPDQGKNVLAGAQRIQRSAGRMTRLIGDLVDIASIDAGKLAVVHDDVDATAVILEALETWGPPAATKGIVLESSASAAGTLPASLDHERVLQILGNLVTNALKFSERGTKVVLGVEEVEGELRFSVRDSGVGISSDKLVAIFERFWQVGGNDRRGLGLGLYISKCLVHAHGGTIWAESEVGIGSTFFFTIPPHAPQPNSLRGGSLTP